MGGSWRWRRHPASMTANTYRYHTELTARIMAGASAQRYGTRTATRRRAIAENEIKAA